MNGSCFAIVIGQRMEEWQVHCVKRIQQVGGALPLIIMENGHKKTLSLFGVVGEHIDVIPPEDMTQELCKQYNLSFILQFEACYFENVAEVLPLGIWAFRNRDGVIIHSRTAYKETYHGHHTTSIYLTMNQGEGNVYVLKEGHFTTVLHSWRATKNEIDQAILSWPALLVKVHQNEGERSFKRYITNQYEQSTLVPSIQEHGLMFLKLLHRKLRRNFQRMFREEYWNVGIVDLSIDKLLAEPLPAISWATSSRTSYYADPFGIYEDGKVKVFMEELKPYRVHGVVSRASYMTDNVEVRYEQGAVLQQTNHLSYPFLLQEEGEVYCVPESAERGEVSLYRWSEEKQCFAHDCTLIEGFNAIDSTLLYDGECWWLFCTVLKENSESHNRELHLFYSDQLKEGWQPHLLNPVKVDSRSSRSAGTPFCIGQTWYRPAQDCSVTYGGAVVINEIVTLTKNDYEERVVTTITPCKDSRFPNGIHTLSSVGPYTLLDGKRFRYHLLTPFRKWAQKTIALYP